MRMHTPPTAALRLCPAAEGEGEGEGEGGGVGGGGCFPTFETAADFETYIDGKWVYSEPSIAVGIALSCVFFVSLVLLAFLIKS